MFAMRSDISDISFCMSAGAVQEQEQWFVRRSGRQKTGANAVGIKIALAE
jgi:hypothetical protein